jgi:hypothetical protein
MSNYLKKILFTLLIFVLPYMNSVSKAMDAHLTEEEISDARRSMTQVRAIVQANHPTTYANYPALPGVSYQTQTLDSTYDVNTVTMRCQRVVKSGAIDKVGVNDCILCENQIREIARFNRLKRVLLNFNIEEAASRRATAEKLVAERAKAEEERLAAERLKIERLKVEEAELRVALLRAQLAKEKN